MLAKLLVLSPCAVTYNEHDVATLLYLDGQRIHVPCRDRAHGADICEIRLLATEQVWAAPSPRL